MTTTFKCHTVTPKNPFKHKWHGKRYSERFEKFSNPKIMYDIFEAICETSVESTDFSLSKGWIPWSYGGYPSKIGNPLIDALLEAYNNHWEMVFSPDDIWLTISAGLAKHINANSEKLRKKFVDWDGKKKIEVRRDSFIKGSPHNDWPGVFNEFSNAIGEFIGKKKDLIVSNFSTTGPIERAASEVTLLDAMQSYFEYHVRTMSGFSRITLLGEVDDWKNIKVRVQNIAEFGLKWWTKHLEPVLDEFIAAAEGRPNVDFWKRTIAHHGGSGRDDISGWIVTLFPYLRDGSVNQKLDWTSQTNWGRGGLDVSKFGPLIAKAPFTWHYYNTDYDMAFLGGLISPAIDRDNQRVRTVCGWAVGDAVDK